jgi:hypothetical protein
MSLDYYEFFKNGNDREYISRVSEEYNNMFGPPIRVYRLDKKATMEKHSSGFSEVYGEGTRPTDSIFLPAVILKTNREDLIVAQELSKMGLLDNLEIMDISLNASHMVKKFQEAKNSHTADLYIHSGNSGITNISINNGYFYIDQQTGDTGALDLTKYTITSLSKYLREQGFNVSSKGNNINASELEDFDTIDCSTNKVNFYAKQHVYDNVSDAIEPGDLVIDHNYALKIVTNAYLGDSIAWNYHSYHLKLHQIGKEGIDLPNGDIELLKNYSFQPSKVGDPNV